MSQTAVAEQHQPEAPGQSRGPITQQQSNVRDDYQPHEYAELFPVLEETDPEFERLAEDVRANGIIEPIVLLGGAARARRSFR
jgi:hypothetical protein